MYSMLFDVISFRILSHVDVIVNSLYMIIVVLMYNVHANYLINKKFWKKKTDRKVGWGTAWPHPRPHQAKSNGPSLPPPPTRSALWRLNCMFRLFQDVCSWFWSVFCSLFSFVCLFLCELKHREQFAFCFCSFLFVCLFWRVGLVSWSVIMSNHKV